MGLINGCGKNKVVCMLGGIIYYYIHKYKNKKYKLIIYNEHVQSIYFKCMYRYRFRTKFCRRLSDDPFIRSIAETLTKTKSHVSQHLIGSAL